MMTKKLDPSSAIRLQKLLCYIVFNVIPKRGETATCVELMGRVKQRRVTVGTNVNQCAVSIVAYSTRL